MSNQLKEQIARLNIQVGQMQLYILQLEDHIEKQSFGKESEEEQKRRLAGEGLLEG